MISRPTSIKRHHVLNDLMLELNILKKTYEKVVVLQEPYKLITEGKIKCLRKKKTE